MSCQRIETDPREERPVVEASRGARLTVKLCNDLTGWFATLSDDVAEYPGVTVHSEHGFETSAEALRALDLTQVLAHRLGGSPWPGQAAERRP